MERRRITILSHDEKSALDTEILFASISWDLAASRVADVYVAFDDGAITVEEFDAQLAVVDPILDATYTHHRMLQDYRSGCLSLEPSAYMRNYR